MSKPKDLTTMIGAVKTLRIPKHMNKSRLAQIVSYFLSLKLTRNISNAVHQFKSNICFLQTMQELVIVQKRDLYSMQHPPLKDKFWKEKSFHTISRPKVLLVIRSFYMRKTSYGTSKKCFPELIMVVSILIWSLKCPFVHHANLHCKISLVQQPR